MNDTPLTSLLWMKMMDVCRSHGFAPSRCNDLFALVDNFRSIEQGNTSKTFESVKCANKRCNCGICLLSRHLQTIAPKCTPEELSALNILWGRMEYAEMQLEDFQSKSNAPHD